MSANFHGLLTISALPLCRILAKLLFPTLSLFCLAEAVSVQFSSVQFSSVHWLSHVWLFATPWTAACQASLLLPTPEVYLNSMSIELVMPSNHLILCHPLLLLPSIFTASGSFQMSQLFASGGQSIGISASTSVLPTNTQDWFPLGWLVGSPCCPRDSQESSPTPQFKSIDSLVLSFLHSPTLTSIHDY